MVTVRWSSALLTLLCVACALVSGVWNSLLILALVFLLVHWWAVGAFTWAYWCADADTSARLAAVDEQLDFEEAVIGDLSSLDSGRDPRV